MKAHILIASLALLLLVPSHSQNNGGRSLIPLNSSAPDSLVTNLIGYWRLDEASGTRVDVLGANDLTQAGTVNGVTGIITNAAAFTGVAGQTLSHADNADLSTAGTSFTVSLWAKLNTVTASSGTAQKFGASGEREYIINYNSSATRWEFITYTSNGSSPKIVRSDVLGAPVTNVWYHIIATLDLGTNNQLIYVNNGAGDTATSAFTTKDTTSAFQIGDSFISNVSVDELGFWKRVLTSTERSNLYNSGSGKTYPFTP